MTSFQSHLQSTITCSPLQIINHEPKRWDIPVCAGMLVTISTFWIAFHATLSTLGFCANVPIAGILHGLETKYLTTVCCGDDSDLAPVSPCEDTWPGMEEVQIIKINHHQEQWINISILNQQFQIFNVKIESDSILDGALRWLLLQWLPVPKSLLPNPRKYGCKCFSTGISRIKDKTSS